MAKTQITRDWVMHRVRVDDVSGCWVWSRSLQWDGYGRLRNTVAHKLVYEALVGPVPAELVLDHKCRNRACVNPAHLDPVLRSENQRRVYNRGIRFWEIRTRSKSRDGIQYARLTVKVTGRALDVLEAEAQRTGRNPTQVVQAMFDEWTSTRQ